MNNIWKYVNFRKLERMNLSPVARYVPSRLVHGTAMCYNLMLNWTGQSIADCINHTAYVSYGLSILDQIRACAQ